MKLQQKYSDICNEYVDIFCKKHEIELEYWVGNQVGSIACFGDIYYFDMKDIVEDIDNDYPKGLILKWIEDVVEYSELEKYNMPLSQYAKGERYNVPENTKEDWEYVQNKIDNEGFDYCFRHYSDFEDIKDKGFHLWREAYIRSAESLEKYINDKISSYDI